MPYNYLKTIDLNPLRHKLTKNTRHFVYGEQIEDSITSLKIVQCRPDAGFYLLYFDASGKELTDTYHSTVNEAMEQAKWEFGVEVRDWEDVIEKTA